MQRLLLAVLASVACVAARAGDGGITDLSIEQLSNIQVTSVSKSGEALQNAPATIYVITHDDIVRSGVTSIAEALRLAPNLQITQYSSTNYVAGARGFAGAQEVQNFSNKLLILIDGRSVYTPIYSGVYLDAQDVALADIDRIEVISGPGATLWGANAMNGVINIITRAAYLTQGTMVDAGYGDAERTLTARYGAKAGDAWSWRVYGKTFEHDPLELRDGTSARDGWDKAQGGFRADWTSIADTVTTQGDGYRAFDQQAGTAKARVEGANLLARWQHRGTTEWQLQSYYDYTERAQPPGGVAFALRTYDVEWQQKVNATRQRIVWGAGGRMHQYYITPTQPLSFDPAERTLGLGDLFVSDTISLPAEVALTLGLKAERDPYSGWALLPDVRAGWHVAERQLVWASASRAIRSPTPFDADVRENIGTTQFLTGDTRFKTEKVYAFETGWRAQPWNTLSLSASLFYDIYNDLRTIELNSNGNGYIVAWGNQMHGTTRGFEAWAKWQALPWWQLSPGVRLLRKDLRYRSESISPLLGIGTAESGNDPSAQALLDSSMDLGRAVTLDLMLRHQGSMPSPYLASFQELNATLAWHVAHELDISLTGANLLHARHAEYPDPSGEFVQRSVLAQLRWNL